MAKMSASGSEEEEINEKHQWRHGGVNKQSDENEIRK